MIYGLLGSLTQPIMYWYNIGVLGGRAVRQHFQFWCLKFWSLVRVPTETMLCAFLSLHTALIIYNEYMCVLLV